MVPGGNRDLNSELPIIRPLAAARGMGYVDSVIHGGGLDSRIMNLFGRRYYQPSCGLVRAEWEIILEEFLAMGLIVKVEPPSP
jgi:hypothetical protein